MNDVTRVTGTQLVKRGLAEMLKGGVIMDVVDPAQARIAEDAGASAVMALERVPADIRRDGGVARMSDPEMIEGIKEAVTIPVMAKARIGHFAEAQILQQLEQLRETFVVLYGRPLGAAALVVGAFRDPPAVHAARRLVVHRPAVQLSAAILVRPDDGIV